MREYRDKPKNFVEPTEAEIKARGKRNIALALALLGFTAFVFITMISRGELPS